MTLSSRAHQLFEAFAQPGCPVCRLTAASVHHYLGSLVYEYVNKPATHQTVRAARGFCTTHAWHALDDINASTLGLALLYEGLVRNMLKEMGEVTPSSGRRAIAQAAAVLEPRAPCPVCEHRDRVEEHLLRNLLEPLDQAEFSAAFRASDGLCLPHLRQALGARGSQAAKATLLTLQQAIWGELQADLAEYIRLSDYQYADEELTEEAGSSARRAIQQMAGRKDAR